MQTRKRSIFERIVSGALALSLASSGLMTNVAAASATGPTPPDTTISAPASQPTSPTVVRELTEERTETSRSFLLSNGVIRGEYHSTPIHYRDVATNSMKPIDVALQDTTVDGRPVAVNGANGFKLKLPRDLEGDEVSIETSKTSVSLRPRWKNRVGAAKVTTGAVESRSVSATDRVYPEAFVGAGLEYESRADGLKETIVLANPIKDNVFGFDLTLNGVTPRIEADRSISLMSAGSTETLYSIPTPFMMDSSGSTVGDDYSNAVHYEITGAGPTYHLDVVADPAWLADPARVYPVRIDPSITPTSETLIGGNDTFISSKNQGTNYISHTLTWVDKNDPAADWTEYGYIQPHSALISGMATMKAAGKVVVASRLKLHVNSAYVANPGSVMGQMIDTNDIVSLPSLTWTTYAGGAATALSSHPTNTIPISTGGPYTFDVTSMVAYWQGLGLPQDRCTMRLQGMTAGVHIGFDPAENSTYPPVWEIDYAPTPTVSVTAPAGGNVTSVPTARWTYAESLGNPQAEWDLEVATSTAGAAIATAGASNTAASSAIPAPAGGWVDGTKYYVRIRVASSPSAQVPRLWSPWVTKDFTIAAPAPTVSVTSPIGGNTLSIPTAKWTYAESLGNPQDQWQLEVATSTAGASVATTSASNAATSSVLPVPSGGWVLNRAYYVRVRVASSPYTSVRWSPWVTKDFTPVVPSAVTSLSAITTASASWFAETDSNGDGLNDSMDDAADQGRGSASLSWGAVSGATGYNVYLSDGYAYRKVASTTGTSWSTAGKGIFPTDSQIASLAAGTTSNPFLAGTGRDLRDDPLPLYAKTSGASMDATPSYAFRVVPYSANGECVSPTDILVTLPGRSLAVNREARHTEHDLGDILGHDANVTLDQGALELDATDLSIASYGPDASLSRHYSSETSTAGVFAPGWRFNFESTLVTSSSVATWTDSTGEAHRFVRRAGGAWVAPTGLYASLDTTTGGSAITFVKDRSVLSFGLDGRLTSESDRNGNTTGYVWLPSGTDLVIQAANNQSIDVHFELAGLSRSITSAKYVAADEADTVDGTRTVDYSNLSQDQWSVTTNAGTTDANTAAYTYGTAGGVYALTAIDCPTLLTKNDVPAQWTFQYTAAKLSSGGSSEGERTTFSYTGTRVSVGTEGAVVGAAAATTYAAYHLNPDGSLLSRHASTTDTAVDGAATTYEYATTGEVTRESAPDGSSTSRTFGALGQPVRETDARGAVTTFVYEPIHGDLKQKTDPAGAKTDFTYDTRGNQEIEQQDLNATERSWTKSEYDSRGRLTTQTVQLTDTSFSRTVNAYGVTASEPYRTTRTALTESTPGVLIAASIDLGSNTPTSAIITSKSFDAFGNVISETNEMSAVTTSVYSPTTKLRVISSTDAFGVVTSFAYDSLGRRIETKKSVESPDAGTLISGWTRSGLSLRGLELTSARIRSSGDIESTVAHTYDGRGLEIAADNPRGGVSLTYFDAAGNATSEWPEGTAASGTLAATRSTYDASGQKTHVTASGSATPTVTSYALGLVTREDRPDGTWTTYAYDSRGHVISQTDPDGITAIVYDLGGREISRVTNKGTEAESTTTATFDLAGHQITSGSGGAESHTTYNALGWELSKTDPDGVATTKTYDAAGRVLSEKVADKTATTAFTSSGRTLSTTDPDGKRVEYLYDPLGRIAEESHLTSTGATLKETQVSFDEFNRPVATTETVSGTVRSFVYATNSAQADTETVTYGGMTTTIARSTAGLELQRSSTGADVTITRVVTKRDFAQRAEVTSGSLDPTGAVITSTRTFDGAGRIRTQSGTGLKETATYGYDDGDGRKKTDRVALQYDGVIADGDYTYTGDGRLKSSSAGTTETYSWDQGGNLTAVTPSPGATTTLSYGAGNRLSQMGTTLYGWDSTHGWRISMKRSGESTVNLGYTGTGRLASYVDTTTSRATTATYDYDAAGQRTASHVITAGATVDKVFTYEGLTLLSVSATSSVEGTWSVTYLYDEEGRPYGGVYRENTSTAVPFGVVANDRGDVLELLDKKGTAFATYKYDAWGNPILSGTFSQNTAAAPSGVRLAARQPLRYAGYCWDAETGYYYLSARTYDPTTRQFLTKDPAKADGEESAYQYCGGDPVGKVDPSGEAPRIHRIPQFERRRGVYEVTNYFLRVFATNAGYARYIGSTHLWGGYVYKLLWWASMEGPNRPWDIKRRMFRTNTYGFMGGRLRFDDIGNLHYGYVGHAYGLSLTTLLRGAGAGQIMVGSSSWAYRRSNFDDPHDQDVIRRGYRLYEQLPNRGWDGSFYAI